MSNKKATENDYMPVAVLKLWGKGKGKSVPLQARGAQTVPGS